MARVHLDRVTVDFPIFSSKARSLRFALANRLGGALERDRGSVIVRALDGVSLDLAGGDRLAVVGHNGSGKTTLLRTIAGVYPPLTGTMAIEGKISAFTDLMLGMDLEASGSENIIFRLVFLGLTFAEARKLAPEIGEFTELGDYLDMPVRTYSMGMMLRLAFAIATAIHPDILLMDEMVSTGDPAFIDKAMARIKSLLDRTSILVLASQMPPLLEMFCNRAVWLDHGRIRALGSTREVLGLYLDSQSQDRGKETPPQAKSASSPAASGGAQAADRAGG